MKLIKIHLRNNLLDTNHTSINTMSIGKRKVKSLDFDKIINKFLDFMDIV